MQNHSLLEQLNNQIAGILFYSESEYPLTISEWGVLPAAGVQQKIAALHDVESQVVRSVDAVTFFDQICNPADPNDMPMVANAQRFHELYLFLKENLSDIQVSRVETGTSIPVYITGHQPDGTCIALATTAIES